MILMQLMMVSQIMTIMSCVSPRICHLVDRTWILVVHFTLYQTRTSLSFISARIVVKYNLIVMREQCCGCWQCQSQDVLWYHENIDQSEACFRIKKESNFIECLKINQVSIYFRRWCYEGHSRYPNNNERNQTQWLVRASRGDNDRFCH